MRKSTGSKAPGVIPSAPMKKHVSLILVDMGGVLALHSDISLEQSLLRDFGIEQHESFCELDPTLPLLLQEHSKNSIDEKEMWRRFTERTHIEVPPFHGSLWAKYFNPTLDTAMENLLQELKKKGYRIVCATNTEPAHYAYHLKHNQYALFHHVYASCEIGHAKPEYAFFSHILLQESVSAEQAFFIDDNLDNCKAAAEVGITAHQYLGVENLRLALIDMGIL